MSYQNNKSEIKLEKEKNILDDLNNDLNDLFLIFYSNGINLYSQINKFKEKYISILTENELNGEIETKFINNFSDFHNKNQEKNCQNYLQLLFDIYDILPYFYHPNEFNNKFLFDQNKLFSVDKINFLELFHNISPYQSSKLNNLLDSLIEFLFNNYNDYKSLFIENNLLMTFPRKSAYLSLKLICLQLHLYKCLNINNNKINKFLYNESLTNISKSIFNEFSFLVEYIRNNSDYNETFEKENKKDFEKEQYNFLHSNLFHFLFIILNIFSYHFINNNYDFTDNKYIKIFWKQIDYELKEEKNNIALNNDDFAVYTFYILISFCCDLLSFIYGNFLVLSEKSLNNCELSFLILSIDKLISFKTVNINNVNDITYPSFYIEFRNFIVQNIFSNFIKNKIKFIEIYMSLINLKKEYPILYKKVSDRNLSFNYFIINPFDSLGISYIIYLSYKNYNQKNNYFLYSPLYIYDTHLSLISNLIMHGKGLRFIGFDFLLIITKLFNRAIIPHIDNLINFEYDKLFNEILDYIGAMNEPEALKKHVNNNITFITSVLSNDAIFEFFNTYINTYFKFFEDQNFNDDKFSYFIQIIKKILIDNFQLGNSEIFNGKKIKKIIEKILFVSFDNFFIFEIIETISQILNFLHFIILKDKTFFKGKLEIYNKNYLNQAYKKLNEISLLVNNFLKSPDSEKYKTLKLDNYSQNKNDIQKAFNQKKNQCQLLLNLVSIIDNLILKSLKEID